MVRMPPTRLSSATAGRLPEPPISWILCENAFFPLQGETEPHCHHAGGCLRIGLRLRQGCRAAALAAVCACAQAQVARPSDELDLLAQENRVVSAARYVQTIAETPANVTVITREEIRRYAYASVREAISALPGVYDATSQWPELGVSGIAVPGDFGSRVLYLVNGMPIYEPTYGGFFLDYVDIESIERIEFVKGAGSARYGSGAVMGLVNLITRTSTDNRSISAAMSLASHRQGKLYGAIGHQQQSMTSFISASVDSSSGRDLVLPEFNQPAYNSARYHGVSAGNDAERTLRVFGRLTLDQAWLQALLVSASKRDPLASYGTVFNGRLALRESLAALEAGFNRDLGQGGEMSARTYLFDIGEKGDYPYAFSGARGVPADYINVSDLSSRQVGAELRYDRFFDNGHHLLVGVEAKRVGYAHQVGDQPGLERAGVKCVDVTNSYTQWAVFAQDELRLFGGKLFLGARFDSYAGLSDGVTSRISPRIAFVRNLEGGTTAKLVYGEAYRAPTIYESRYQDGLPAASTIWANRALRPELSRSLEALLLARPQDPLQWRLSTYLKTLHDTPEQVVTPRFEGLDCGVGPDGCIQYRNSGRTQKVAGAEGELRLRDGERGDLYASLVLQHGWDELGELTSSPRRMAKLGVSRVLPWLDADAAIELQAVSAVAGRADPGAARHASLPGYLSAAFVLNLPRIGDGWRASLRVDNLFDAHYASVASRELQPLERIPADSRRAAIHFQRGF